MPKYDGTGPQGAGPMTGRGYGPCADNAPCGMPYGMRGGGFGWRGGFGRCRGLGAFFGWGPQSKKDRLEALAEYKKALEEELEDLKAQEEELGKSK